MQHHHLRRVIDTGNARHPPQSCANDQTIFVYPPRISWEQSLPWRIQPVTKQTPLSAVRMTTDNDIDILCAQIRHIILGIVTQ